MDAIFSSKMYRTSNRKSNIKAAIADLKNQELVKQLKSYLDDPSLAESPKPAKKVVINEEPSNPKNHNKPDVGSISRPGGGGGSSLSDGDFDAPLNSDDFTDTGADIADMPGVNIDSESSDDSNESAEAATITNKARVYSAECCTPCTFDSSILTNIKGSLNNVQDCAGVSRILIKDSELWIYYEDKINLNSVMGTVIEYLNSWGYTNLEFNRLARSDNAMVFEIQSVTSEMNVASVEGDESDATK